MARWVQLNLQVPLKNDEEQMKKEYCLVAALALPIIMEGLVARAGVIGLTRSQSASALAFAAFIDEENDYEGGQDLGFGNLSFAASGLAVTFSGEQASAAANSNASFTLASQPDELLGFTGGGSATVSTEPGLGASGAGGVLGFFFQVDATPVVFDFSLNSTLSSSGRDNARAGYYLYDEAGVVASFDLNGSGFSEALSPNTVYRFGVEGGVDGFEGTASAGWDFVGEFAEVEPEDLLWIPEDPAHLWSDEANWEPFGAPTVITRVLFNGPGATTVNFAQDAEAHAVELAGDGTNVTFAGNAVQPSNLFADGLVMGKNLLDDVTLQVEGMTLQVDSDAVLGSVRGAEAKLIVGAGGSVNASDFFLGAVEKAELEIKDGGSVAAVNLYVAEEFANGSKITVDDGLLAVQNLLLGNTRPAELTTGANGRIEASGQVRIDHGSVATIQGSGTNLNAGVVSVDHGKLELKSLAEAEIRRLTVAESTLEDDPSLATLVVDSLALLTVQNELKIGDAVGGRGGLATIQGGAVVSVQDLVVAGGAAENLQELVGARAGLKVTELSTDTQLLVGGTVEIGAEGDKIGEIVVESAASVKVDGASTTIHARGGLFLSDSAQWMQEFGDLDLAGSLWLDGLSEATFDSIVVQETNDFGGGFVSVVLAGLHAKDRMEIGGQVLLQDGILEAPVEVLVQSTGRLDGTGEVDTPRLHAEEGGHIAPGLSPGRLTVTGDVELDASSVLEIEIGGLVAGEEHDVLAVGGDLTLAGDVMLEFIGGFAPQQGDVVEFLAVEGASDLASATFEIMNLAKGFEYELATSTGGYQLTALNDAQFRFAADFFFDGKVDLLDFNTLKSNFGSSDATQDDGDADSDGDVDLIDFSLLKGQFGVSVAVPEPSSLGIAAIGILALAAGSRRRLL